MSKICYINKNFGKTSQEIIIQANEILDAYQEEGFVLTLRQLYYQFVARGLLPNTQQSYKRLGSIVNDGRLAGLIDWGHIQDRTRNLKKNPHWTSPGDIIESAAQSYRIDLWKDQKFRIEVWIEKDALVGVIEGICTGLDVPFFACRGYPSQSEVWAAAQRIRGYIKQDQIPVIIHLGDHDPSGIDMTRDILDRLELLTCCPGEVEIRRIALNMDQIEEYAPPPNPAKVTDSRARGYITKYGTESWELDALEPSVINDLIKDEISSYLNLTAFEARKELMERQRDELVKASRQWEDIVEFMNL